jgi:hypothetical protein
MGQGPGGRAKSDQTGVLSVEIHRQPDDVTCGPTCLHAVYRYWGIDASLSDVVRSVRSLRHDGAGEGTLAVNLGVDALKRGLRATLYTFNLTVFDPTWFDADGVLPQGVLAEKLQAQAKVKAVDDRKFQAATEAYLEFGRLGGVVRLQDLTSRLISGHIKAGRPVLTGLSATYLYRAAREYGPNDDEDDVRGLPQGHFVVLHGYDSGSRSVHVADPLDDNPGFSARNYTVPMSRIVPSIMLGVLTYDANLLILEPGDDADAKDRAPKRTKPS